jgi:dephospho-CoA kinase
MAGATRIGIAGYMGAGKTTCARLFESDDALIINADDEAKALMARDRRMLDDLSCAFGGAVVGDDGSPRFDVLGQAAFQSKESLLTLNSITHPSVVRYVERLVAGCTKSLCILDAALIPLWADMESWFDHCIWADAPFDVRLERLKAKRADVDEGELVRRMRLQEEIMPVPVTGRWVRLPDADCRGYIAGVLNG